MTDQDRNNEVDINNHPTIHTNRFGDNPLERRISAENPHPAFNKYPLNTTIAASGPTYPAQEDKVVIPQVEPAASFLKEAMAQMQARAELRDTPEGERTAKQIAKVFNAITGNEITEADAWIFLIVLKLVRSMSGKYCKDDYVDLAAYASLLGECESTRKR
jgi:hypothetical protein